MIPSPRSTAPWSRTGSFLLPAAAGERVLIARVGDETTGLLSYLGERGLVPGRLLTVEEVRTLNGDHAVAGAQFVRSAPEDG